MTENSDFPEEILVEIFSRLPAKAVGRCRCLSKTWYANLSTSEFINLHATLRTRPENLFLKTPWDAIYVTSAPINDTVVSKGLQLGTSLAEVAGSCNGLVLVANSTLPEPEKMMELCDLILVNPITLQRVKVPGLPLPFTGHHWRFYTGLGYDSCTDDYKIVSGYSWRTPCEALLDVYSVKFGAWKRVNIPPDYAHVGLSYGAFTDGALHWVSQRKKGDAVPFIVAFNLTDEVLYEMAFPNIGCVRELRYYRVFVLDGCLCIVDQWSSNSMHIWMMKQYGSSDSWTKLSLDMEDKWSKIPLCFISNKEIMLVTTQWTVAVHNLEDGTTKDISFGDIIGNCFVDGVSFVDSLVFPIKGEEVGTG